MQRLHKQLGADGYQVVRSNDQWPDHQARALVTGSMVAWMHPHTVIDPACGDLSIVRAAHALKPIEFVQANDISIPQMADHWGKDYGFRCALTTKDAFDFLMDAEYADLIVLTEILEHLEEPVELLKLARMRASHLVVSSPIDEEPGRGNHEHVWSFSEDDYLGMLRESGWSPVAFHRLEFVPRYYDFQLFACV